LLAGTFTLILGLLRFGFLAQIFSRPILVGFINAVAVEIAIEQSDVFFGVSNPTVHGFKKFEHIAEFIGDTNYYALIIGLGKLKFSFIEHLNFSLILCIFLERFLVSEFLS
jgi:MFS superfamily sulfate permease-like transporter